ncbi:hypothetical protein AX16_007772 [Volvariella volvacea WC 439]|nr:hypothetical protein AX16_007772 [Volvariella volvacea WC 439]
MPPRTAPKVFHITIRTHKLSILLSVSPTTTISEIKDEVYSALSSDVGAQVEEEESLPSFKEVDDFDLCKDLKDRGKPTGMFEKVEVGRQIKDLGLASWDTLYIQFRDESGELLPVTFTTPSINDDDPALMPPPSSAGALEAPVSAKSKGKRKAREEDEYEDEL